jgi:hypothetical protein
MRSLRRRLAPLALALASLAVGGSPRVYRNPAMRVRAFEPPIGWELAPQASYPRLLASYSHKEGGRLTLTGQHVAKETTAAQLVEQSRAALERQGFTSIRVQADGPRVRLSAQLEGGRRAAEQLYVVEEQIGYVVTLVAPAAHRISAERDFEEAVRSLQIGPDEGAP